jgi:hypothetical protein
MVFLILHIGFLQNLMDLLVDVLNPLNESSDFVGLRMNMGRFHSVWLQEVVKHQWDRRIGIPTLPKMGYG